MKNRFNNIWYVFESFIHLYIHIYICMVLGTDAELWDPRYFLGPSMSGLTSRPRGPSRVVGPREVSRSRTPLSLFSSWHIGYSLGHARGPSSHHPMLFSPARDLLSTLLSLDTTPLRSASFARLFFVVQREMKCRIHISRERVDV